MNVAYLLNRYFNNCGTDVLIEVFDDKNIYSVYTDIVKGLSDNPNVELGVIQALSYFLNFDGKKVSVLETDYWQGSVICFELKSDVELDSKDILNGRVDAESEFNDTFIDSDDLDDLW